MEFIVSQKGRQENTGPLYLVPARPFPAPVPQDRRALSDGPATLHLHQDDVLPDLHDLVPGDNDIVSAAEKTAPQLGTPRYDDRTDGSTLAIDDQIEHMADASSIEDVHHLFLFDVTKPLHGVPPSFLYYMPRNAQAFLYRSLRLHLTVPLKRSFKSSHAQTLDGR